MNDNLTYIAVVLDRSGSMESCKQPTISGFNEFLHQQKLEPGDARLYLAQFDHEYDLLYDKPLREADELTGYTYQPRGMTALYDAIGRTIKTLGEKFAKQPEKERPGKVLVAIITDGYENHSTEYFRHQIADMVKEQQEKYSWRFVFIGANQDAIFTAAQMNINRGSAITYTANNVSQVMGQTMSKYVGGVRGMSVACCADPNSMTFDKEDRAKAVAG
jgi:hypothetical protein